jgi:hypothetical protein
VTDYSEHPSRTAAWRDGAFVVHPDAAAEDCTVWVPVVDGPVDWEGLLACRTGPDSARISAIPLWVYDLHLGDEVQTMDSAEGAPVIIGPVASAGQHTFRVRFTDAAADDTRWQDLMKDLEPAGCWFDVSSPGYLAVSAGPLRADEVDTYLRRRATAGELAYERARSIVQGPHITQHPPA